MVEPIAERRVTADLECVVVDPTSSPYQPNALVVLCHGFGAPGTDLVDCCRAMWQLEPTRLGRTRFVFPAAPMALAAEEYGDARAWWMIDMERLMMSIQTGAIRELRHEIPAELPERREQLSSAVRTWADEAGLDSGRVFLGGFSQGAMLATDVALHLPQACGGLIVWSGTLLAERVWRAASARQDKFRVFQSHGRFDPILPYSGALALKQLFEDHAIGVEFNPFEGMHEIPLSALRGAAGLITEQLERSS